MTKQPNTPTSPKGEFRPESQYSEQYIKDRERIDNLAKNINNQLLQVNKQLTCIQIIEWKFLIQEHDKEKHVKKVPVKKQLWMWMIKAISKPVIWYHKSVTMLKRKPKTS